MTVEFLSTFDAVCVYSIETPHCDILEVDNRFGSLLGLKLTETRGLLILSFQSMEVSRLSRASQAVPFVRASAEVS